MNNIINKDTKSHLTLFFYSLVLLLASNFSYGQNNKFGLGFEYNFTSLDTNKFQLSNESFFDYENFDFSIESNYIVRNRYGKLLSINDELRSTDEFYDFIGMFISSYDSKRKLKVNIKLDDSYNIEKTIIAFRIRY